MEERLPTHIWTGAIMRRLAQQGAPAYVVQKGDLSGGVVLVKIALLNGECRLQIQQRDIDGVMGWVSPLKTDIVPEQEADAYIQRSIQRDPDLWVIEVEDRDGINPFDESGEKNNISSMSWSDLM